MLGITALLIAIFNGPGPSVADLHWTHSTHESVLVECTIHGVGAATRTVTTIGSTGPGDPVIVTECTYRTQRKP